jgi:hypothetical protein
LDPEEAIGSRRGIKSKRHQNPRGGKMQKRRQDAEEAARCRRGGRIQKRRQDPEEAPGSRISSRIPKSQHDHRCIKVIDASKPKRIRQAAGRRDQRASRMKYAVGSERVAKS